ncbi:MAG: hypothetical protein HZA90_11530 [Verrucomicrobia bacterium]|nr:hypothetical protein [Verrucomicrobiota bacterium]
MRYAIVLAALIFTGGCFRPGGGHAGHTPPERIVAGEPTILKMEFSVWGAGSGDLSKRYTQIVCHYRQTGQRDFQTAHARVLSSNRERMQTEFTIPPQTLLEAAGTLEYYFEFLFDGHRNANHTNSVSIVRPPKTVGRANLRPSASLSAGMTCGLKRSWNGR